MPRISEDGYPSEVYLCCAGKAQRLEEQVHKLRCGIKHWSASDQANAWGQVRMLEGLIAKLNAMNSRGIGQIRRKDYAKLENAAIRDCWIEALRASNQRAAGLQIQWNQLWAKLGSARTDGERDVIRGALSELMAGQAAEFNCIPTTSTQRAKQASATRRLT